MNDFKAHGHDGGGNGKQVHDIHNIKHEHQCFPFIVLQELNDVNIQMFDFHLFLYRPCLCQLVLVHGALGLLGTFDNAFLHTIAFQLLDF